MIYGIGTDIVDIKRIKKIDSIDGFAKKILSINEFNYFNNLDNTKKYNYLAKQFSGKEAISKAIGIGITKDTKLSEIEILRDENGKPYFEAIGNLKSFMDNLGISKTHVSLSDEKDYAIAFAILET